MPTRPTPMVAAVVHELPIDSATTPQITAAARSTSRREHLDAVVDQRRDRAGQVPGADQGTDGQQDEQRARDRRQRGLPGLLDRRPVMTVLDPMSAAIAQHRISATWIGPSSASSPNSASDAAIRKASATSGISASAREGRRIGGVSSTTSVIANASLPQAGSPCGETTRRRSRTRAIDPASTAVRLLGRRGSAAASRCTPPRKWRRWPAGSPVPATAVPWKAPAVCHWGAARPVGAGAGACGHRAPDDGHHLLTRSGIRPEVDGVVHADAVRLEDPHDLHQRRRSDRTGRRSCCPRRA